MNGSGIGMCGLWRLPGGMAVLFLLAAVPARAEVAIAGKAGSLGLGLELTAGLSPRILQRAVGLVDQRRRRDDRRARVPVDDRRPAERITRDRRDAPPARDLR